MRNNARRISLPPLDGGQVHALATLLKERSVSKAAQSLGQSQPQVSATLRRLREILGDPILVRSRRGMTPTAHALSLLEPAQRILKDMESLVAAPARFDPLTMRHTLKLAIPDYLSAGLLAAILGALRKSAPLSSTLLCPVRSDSDGADMLESAQADLLIESAVIRSRTIRYATLFDDAVLAVAARAHPSINEKLSVEEYLALPHVAAAPASGTHPGLIDRMLADQRLARRVVAWVPYLNALPRVLASTDLVLTSTAHMARHIASQADLQLFTPPIAFPRIRYFLMWHDRAHRSAEHRWLRELVRDSVSAQF